MSNIVENFVKNIRALTTAGDLRDLAEQLHDSLDMLMKNWGLLDNVLEMLHAQEHSLGVLFVLTAKFSSGSVSTGDSIAICQQLSIFFKDCDIEQIRIAQHVYYELCHMFANYIVDHTHVMQGIPILVTAIERVRLTETQLTPIHADLGMLCLKCGCFKPALSFLNTDMTDISTASEYKSHPTVIDTNNDAKYFLSYYFYGGMIYTSMQMFEKALYFYEVCISTPATTMSHIMLEAYKKFVLVSLILYGKIAPVPKFSSQVVSRFMKPVSNVYHDLANAYATSSSDEFCTVMNKFREVLERDKNFGLAKQVAVSLHKKNIKRLTKTFLTLSLADVASRVELPSADEAEEYILNMIKTGEIFAKINQKDGMVVFEDNPQKFNSPEMLQRIKNSTTHVIKELKQISRMDEEIMLNPAYIRKTIGNQEEELSTQHAKPYSGDPMD